MECCCPFGSIHGTEQGGAVVQGTQEGRGRVGDERLRLWPRQGVCAALAGVWGLPLGGISPGAGRWDPYGRGPFD